LTIESDRERKAFFARKKPAKGKAPKVPLWSHKTPKADTGLGKFEARVVKVLARDLVDLLPEELGGEGFVSLDVWPDITHALQLSDHIKGYPDTLEARQWTASQGRAIQAVVAKQLEAQGLRVVATRRDVLASLAKEGRLREDHFRAVPNLIRNRTPSIEEARREAEKGRTLYSIQTDGKAIEGLHAGAKEYVAIGVFP
jgi:hypothetical protein